MKRDNHPKPLYEALEDHSAEGIAILTAEPVRIAQALVLTMVALVVAGLLWSFIGRTDVIGETLRLSDDEGRCHGYGGGDQSYALRCRPAL